MAFAIFNDQSLSAIPLVTTSENCFSSLKVIVHSILVPLFFPVRSASQQRPFLSPFIYEPDGRFIVYLAHEVISRHAKQLQPKLNHPLLDRRNDMAAQLLHEMEDRGTREEIFLIRGNALNVISFFPTSVENRLLLMDCLDGYTLMLRKIEGALLA